MSGIRKELNDMDGAVSEPPISHGTDCEHDSVDEHDAMMASMEADNVSTSASPLLVNPSRIRLCWRARASVIASACTMGAYAYPSASWDQPYCD